MPFLFGYIACQRVRWLPRYIYMQEEKHLDCYSDLKSNKTDYEPQTLPMLPTSYDWRYSNCDERRTGPCRRTDVKTLGIFH